MSYYPKRVFYKSPEARWEVGDWVDTCTGFDPDDDDSFCFAVIVQLDGNIILRDIGHIKVTLDKDEKPFS